MSKLSGLVLQDEYVDIEDLDEIDKQRLGYISPPNKQKEDDSVSTASDYNIDE